MFTNTRGCPRGNLPNYRGSGLIGSNIAKTLVAKGKKVEILDNFNTGKKDNIAEFIDEIEARWRLYK